MHKRHEERIDSQLEKDHEWGFVEDNAPLQVQMRLLLNHLENPKDKHSIHNHKQTKSEISQVLKDQVTFFFK